MRAGSGAVQRCNTMLDVAKVPLSGWLVGWVEDEQPHLRPHLRLDDKILDWKVRPSLSRAFPAPHGTAKHDTTRPMLFRPVASAPVCLRGWRVQVPGAGGAQSQRTYATATGTRDYFAAMPAQVQANIRTIPKRGRSKRLAYCSCY
jgi:hypothetical protein